MGESSALVKLVEDALNEGDTLCALKIFRDQVNYKTITNNAWDLIPVICKFTTEQHQKNNLEVFKCSEELVNFLAHNADPEDALLQLIEEIEEATDDIKFVTILKPLQEVILRLPEKRLTSLAWCFNAVQCYFSNWEFPQDFPPTDNNETTSECEELFKRICVLFEATILFYDELVPKLCSNCDQSAVVCKFLVQLLGKHFSVLNLKEFEKSGNKERLLAGKILKMVLELNADPMSFLRVLFDEEDAELMEPVGLGVPVVFYLVHSERLYIDLVPNVYDPVHFFQETLHIVTDFLVIDKHFAIEKGLEFAETILKKVSHVKLSYALLDSDIHQNFCRCLTQIIIYHHSETCRKKSLNVLKIYLTSFDSKGFFLLVFNLLDIVDNVHSGLKGYLVTLFKDLLNENLLKEKSNISIYFKGSKLEKFLRKVCRLNEDTAKYLLDSSNEIMAVLNLLRYLALRDKRNVTGILDYVTDLRREYFLPLKDNIEESKKECKSKMESIMMENPASGEKENGNVSVTVGGENLADIPTDEKLRCLHTSLMTFDLIDSLLSRVVECFYNSVPHISKDWYFSITKK